MTNSGKSITIAITWCLAWGEQRQPQFEPPVLQQMRQALTDDTKPPEAVRSLVEQVQRLQAIPKEDFPEKITGLQDKYPDLWQQTTRIGLVYGGATKIKQYVFEAAKLPDIRGASAILDRINLVDIPAFFGEPHSSAQISRWLNKNFPHLEAALIKELLIYYKGGNILAFCPAAFVDDLANAIEKRYTEETLTANSCAVGSTFKLLELRYGLLKDPIEDTPWLEWYHQNHQHPLVKAYFDQPDVDVSKAFQNRKSFNELAGKLAALFNQRRNGNDFQDGRPTRRYPPMFETHPHLRRDEGDRRSAFVHVTKLPDEPWFSETLARKRIMGQVTKEEKERQWYEDTGLAWQFGEVDSWVKKFERFLLRSGWWRKYYAGFVNSGTQQARSLTEIGNASNGFVGYIYADGNNMGGYIQKELITPEDYQKFSRDIFTATKESVYKALEKHLHPHELRGLTGEHQHRNGAIIHPFEILTIGGDDVILIVPAYKALKIAKTIGEEFETILLEGEKIQAKENYRITDEKIISRSRECHRYRRSEIPVPLSQCKLSMSVGVLITAYETPIYYAENLTSQLLKSAKKKAKQLKKWYDYHGGTVDLLTMKSVTMISSNIESFRKEGLTKQPPRQPTLKLYGAPYTLHELEGLLKTAEALKQSEFPRSQLYQIRSLLEQGKHTAMLNYRYFRTRLQPDQQKLLKENFENAWCEAKTNDGNLAPWMIDLFTVFNKVVLLITTDFFSKPEIQLKYVLHWLKKSTYETIWRELVDLYPFIQESEQQKNEQASNAERQS